MWNIAQLVQQYTPDGKIGNSRDKMMNFSAYSSFLTNLTFREKLKPKN
jgi:hypothetical protein